MDKGQDVLLDMDGELVFLEDRSFAKYEVSRCEPTVERPHGLKYSLTYHAPDGTRLVGFDNAHAARAVRRKTGARLALALDHRHRGPNDPGVPYTYSTALKLMEDFWKAVNRAQENRK